MQTGAGCVVEQNKKMRGDRHASLSFDLKALLIVASCIRIPRPFSVSSSSHKCPYGG